MCENCDKEVSEYIETIKDKIVYKYKDFKWFIQSKIQNTALSVIRTMNKDSNYIKHAKKELLTAGYHSLENYKKIDLEEGPNKWIQENIIDLLSVLSTQGHSGGSIGYCLGAFKTLALFEPLTSIKGIENEWNDVSEYHNGETVYQNNRLSSVFKYGKDGIPYYLDAIVFKGQNGSCFTGNGSVTMKDGSKLNSRQNIKFPFIPKTFYIDVIETEWADKEETVEKKGGGWWTSVVKDETQLEEVFKYYEKKA